MFGGFSVAAEVLLADGGGAEGVLCAMGDLNDGWALYLLDGNPVAALVSFGISTRLASSQPVTLGEHLITLEHRPARAGADNLFLLVDGDRWRPVATPGPWPSRPFRPRGAGCWSGGTAACRSTTTISHRSRLTAPSAAFISAAPPPPPAATTTTCWKPPLAWTDPLGLAQP